MSRDRNPKTLTLPEPAAGLWKASRDVLSELMPEERSWERHLGGGTILAARWNHRESTDIDVVTRSVFSLEGLAEPIAKAMDGHVELETPERVVIRKGKGKLDVNMTEIEPAEGLEPTLIDGQVESVMSTTQIVRGKLNRMTPGPVRDAYDLIAASQIDGGSLAAAYNMLKTSGKLVIEATLRSANEDLGEEAKTSLKLKEKSRVDFEIIGTTTAEALEGHRIRRVVIRLEDDTVVTERHARNDAVFQDASSMDETERRWNEIGIEQTLRRARQPMSYVLVDVRSRRSRGYSGLVAEINDPERPSPLAKPTRPVPGADGADAPSAD